MPIPKRIQFSRVRSHGRSPSNYPHDGAGVPMRITRLFPMKLKDVSIEKLKESRQESDFHCMQELMTLFDCFEKSDYNVQTCEVQAKALEQCYSTAMQKRDSNMSDGEEAWDDDFSLPVGKGSVGEFIDDQASEEKDHKHASPDGPEADNSDDDINDFLKDDSSSEDGDDDGKEQDDDNEPDDGVVQEEEGEGKEPEEAAAAATSDEHDDDDDDDEGEEEEEEGNEHDEDAADGGDGAEGSKVGTNALKRLMQSSKGRPKKKHKPKRSEFIDYEAELSGDDVVSDDELEDSDDDDQYDPAIVDRDAKDLSSDEEEEVRRLYHKQLATEDKRAVLILQEQLEENEIGIGQRRRRKFKWQTRELMENSLKRHYDPDDEDSVDDDDMEEYNEVRLRRPTAESLLLGNTKLRCTTVPHAELDDEDMFSDDEEDDDTPIVLTRGRNNRPTGSDLASNEDSSSMFMHALPGTSATGGVNGNLNKYVYRDKELVQALSTKEVLVNTREEKDRIIQRELKKVVQSKSIFDQLY